MKIFPNVTRSQRALLLYIREFGRAPTIDWARVTLNSCGRRGWTALDEDGYWVTTTPLGAEIANYIAEIGTGAHRAGFAALSPERVREIAARGGRAAQSTDRGRRFRPGDPLAVSAGRKGGLAYAASRARVG